MFALQTKIYFREHFSVVSLQLFEVERAINGIQNPDQQKFAHENTSEAKQRQAHEGESKNFGNAHASSCRMWINMMTYVY